MQKLQAELSTTPSVPRNMKVFLSNQSNEYFSHTASGVMADGKGQKQGNGRQLAPPAVPKAEKVIKKKSELGGTHRSTPQPKAAHLQFREYQRMREEAKSSSK